MRTYGSNTAKYHRPTPELSVPGSDPSQNPSKRKRSLFEPLSTNIARPSKRAATKNNVSSSKKGLTQLQFSLDTSLLRTCKICGLTYTKAAIDDEVLHKAHCNRVQKGLDWGKEEERDSVKMGVVEIEDDPRAVCKEKGRIISVPTSAGGKIGQKVCFRLTSDYEDVKRPMLIGSNTN